MSLKNPFMYTSRTFEALLNDINSDSELIDKPNWFKRAIAGIGDVISMWNNAAANNLLLDTSFTRKNTQLLLELIDYSLSPQSTASGIILFYIDGSASFPFTVNVEDLVALTSGTTAVSSKRFESRGNITVNATTETFTADDSTDQLTVAREYTTGEKVRFTTTGTLPSPLAINTDYYVIKVDATHIRISTSLANSYAGIYIDLTDTGTGTPTVHLFSVGVTCYQQAKKDSIVIGESDGITGWQEYELPDLNVLEDTLVITINSVPWTQVDTLIDSGVTDTHYRIFFNYDNSATIQFGNGTYGAIPGAFEIQAEYATGGGEDSNVTTVDNINIYGGADSNITGASNPDSLTGGADPQNADEAKVLGPLLLKARDRFVTTEDGQALAEAYSGIAQAKVIKNFYGVLSAKVITIANGGGNPDGATKTALQEYLINRSILESPDIRVIDTTLTAQNVTSGAKVLSGYTWTGQVENWIRLGWQLFFTETGKEIKADYDANGVDSARALINTIFSENYLSSDNTQISAFLDAWSNLQLTYRIIGEGQILISDAYAFIAAYTQGVDYITISAPAYPITIADDEITTVGTLTLSEIV